MERRRGTTLESMVLAALLERFDDGTYREGTQLPTEKELAEQFEVSLTPVRRAMQQLENVNLIQRRAGQGTFVLPEPLRYDLRLMTSTTGSLRKLGADFSVRVVTHEFARVTDSDAATHGFTINSRAFHLKRLIDLDDRPSILLESWVASRAMPPQPDIEYFTRGGSLFSLMKENGAHQYHATGHVRVHSLNLEEATLFAFPFGTGLLELTSANFDVDHAILDYSRSLYDSSRISLELDRTEGPDELS